MADVLVYVQMTDGEAHDISLQCLAKARELADASSGKVACIAVGHGIAEAAGALFALGADDVFAADDPALAQYLTTPYRKVVSGVRGDRTFAVTLMPDTTDGDDLAPLLAAEAGSACVMGCDAIEGTADAPKFLRREFDRKVVTTFAPAEGVPSVVTVKDGVAAAPVPDASRSGDVQVLTVDAGDGASSRVVSRDVAERTVNLKDAKIVVAAGAGVGSKENFEKIRELASALGAEIGATRAVVDAGWLPADHQIGQTGATVRPDVYIACGISGAVQHRVGMMDARTIIAINTDKSAPIFRIAHYQIVGDVNEVVPRLTKLLG